MFDRIDQNNGWSVSLIKDDANFEIVEKLCTWRGNSIPIEGESVRTVLDDVQRQEIDVRITLSVDRKRGSCASTTRTFRLVGLCNEDTRSTISISRIWGVDDYRVRYRARWEVELLFKELKSQFDLGEINTTDAYIFEALIIMAAISPMMSLVIVDELRTLETMLELGYELPYLDELLLWASRNPNPHRERLRGQVESGEFAFDRH